MTKQTRAQNNGVKCQEEDGRTTEASREEANRDHQQRSTSSRCGTTDFDQDRKIHYSHVSSIQKPQDSGSLASSPDIATRDAQVPSTSIKPRSLSGSQAGSSCTKNEANGSLHLNRSPEHLQNFEECFMANVAKARETELANKVAKRTKKVRKPQFVVRHALHDYQDRLIALEAKNKEILRRRRLLSDFNPVPDDCGTGIMDDMADGTHDPGTADGWSTF